MSKRREPKITLGMLRGKPLTTSVPSIAVKFHANAEQLEELYPSEDESSSKPANAGASTSAGSSEPEGSPMKYFPKLVKRSTSIDMASATNAESSSPQSDPWRFFSDIRGKITRSVEDKITEIKSRNAEEGSPLKAKSTSLPAGSSSASSPLKDNNSSGVSDSEDFSESSISKTCGIVSTTEGAEMSSDDDTPSIEKDKQQNVRKAQVETVHSEGGLRQRFRIFRANLSSSPPTNAAPAPATTTQEGTITTGNLKRLYEINTERVEQALPDEPGEVESGVDALEASTAGNLQKEAAEYDEVVRKSVAGEYANITVSADGCVNVKEVTGEDVARTERSATFYSPVGHVDLRRTQPRPPPCAAPPSSPVRTLMRHLLVIVLLMGGYTCVHVVSSFASGLLAGIVLTYTYFAIKSFMTDKEPENMPYMQPNDNEIIDIPGVHEHQPLPKFEGWVNELPCTYDPYTYHITQTQPVFLRLQGNLLRLSNTKAKIPKRALWNEPRIKATFHHHRIYNLLGAKISLLPEGLAKKRHWSKKYPICITLSNDQMNFDASVAQAKFAEDDQKSFHSTHVSFHKMSKSGKQSNKGKPKQQKSAGLSTQQFSKLAEEDEEYELMDSGENSRATTPSPEQTSEENGSSPVEAQEDINAEFTEKQLASHNLADNLEETPLSEEAKLVDDGGSETTSPNVPKPTSGILRNATSKSEQEQESTQRVTIKEADDGCTRIYIFGRVAREKEDWYRRFVTATHKGAEYSIDSALSLNASVSNTLLDNAMSDIDYIKYMLLFTKVPTHSAAFQYPMPNGGLISLKPRKRRKNVHEPHDEIPTARLRVRSSVIQPEVSFETERDDNSIMWANSLLGRILYDCLNDIGFTEKCKAALQRKLGAIKLPYFIQELECTELSLGQNPPIFHRTSLPVVNDRGLWIDVDLTYQGTIYMMLCTKINLMKLKNKSQHEQHAQQKKHDASHSAIFHSDVEDSPESSSDEETAAGQDGVGGAAASGSQSPLDASGVPIQGLGGTSNTSKKLIKMVDRIADSKLFQAATDNRYIKKAMEGVSNTNLRLSVELKHLFGTLVLNIPPPPTDRLWIGFRPTPDIMLTAVPIVGERSISSLRVTTWIEKKLRQEFQKLFVIPNMEDIYLPVMNKNLPQ